jgi:hypothetical protein
MAAAKDEKADVKPQAELEEETLDKITEDGKEKKQGEKVIKKAFGVVVETNY